MKGRVRALAFISPGLSFSGQKTIIERARCKPLFLGVFAVDAFKKIGKSLLIGSLAGLAIALITNFFVHDLIDSLEDQTYYMRYHWDSKTLPWYRKAPDNRNRTKVPITAFTSSTSTSGACKNWEIIGTGTGRFRRR